MTVNDGKRNKMMIANSQQDSLLYMHVTIENLRTDFTN